MQHDLSQVDAILARYPREEASLVMVLQDVQGALRYLPGEALERVADGLGVQRSRVFSVATFYRAFSLKPRGKVVVQVCKGTACHVRGAQLIEDELARRLGVAPGGTTADLGFTLETVNCVGACAMAPVVVTNGQYHREVKPSQVERIVKKATSQAVVEAGPTAPLDLASVPHLATPDDVIIRAERARAAAAALPGRISVCGGTGCLAAGSQAVHDALASAAKAAGLALRVDLQPCAGAPGHLLSLNGCQGLCQRGPLVHVGPEDTLYTHVKVTDAAEIVAAVKGGGVVERLLGETRGREGDPFFKGQALRVLASCGRIDPEQLDDYLAVGGFAGLARAIRSMTPGDLIDAVEKAGLRGRGGAGFPTARKWRTAVAAAKRTGQAPYVLCNGDEGDPGAFMDRSVMEGAPFQVLEGMILGALAVGAHQGYIYVRHEYPLAVSRLQRALEVCRAAGLLGERILGSDHAFDIRISRGGGAFVCGESTALMRSLEGKVGEPRAKYVRSVERGLHDRPTVLNNVETWALVPGIVREGPGFLADLGTERSRGTKVFSLVGQVQRTGLVEVPMGTTLRQLVFDVGGGVPEGRTFKAVQTGGPSGGCIPASRLDLPLDFEALTEAGSMMGSGGMIVMDDRTCMVDVARYFVEFLQEESCGKCTPCRLGLPQLSHLLRRVTRGEATVADLGRIEDIASGMAGTSLCGLGKSAPNPVLSTLRYFRGEYEAHLRGECPAGVCRALIRYDITEKCTGCQLCARSCPTKAITGGKNELHVIDAAACDRCGICRAVCRYDAVVVRSGGAA